MVELITGCGYGQECERKIKIKTEIKATRCIARIQCYHEGAIHLEGRTGACNHTLMAGRASDADCGQATGLVGSLVWPHATAPASFDFPPYNSPSNCCAAHLGAVLQHHGLCDWDLCQHPHQEEASGSVEKGMPLLSPLNWYLYNNRFGTNILQRYDQRRGPGSEYDRGDYR